MTYKQCEGLDGLFDRGDVSDLEDEGNEMVHYDTYARAVNERDALKEALAKERKVRGELVGALKRAQGQGFRKSPTEMWARIADALAKANELGEKK